MSPDLSGQTILITGAGRGLGKSVAKHLARCGAIMGVNDIDAAACQAAAEEIKANGGRAHAYPGDVAGRDAFMAVADAFAAKAGRIDAVINNAMILRYGPIEGVEEALVDAMLDIGLKAPLWGAQALLKHMDPERGGSIINMASPVVGRGYPNTVVYSTVKGGIVTMTKVLAAELGPKKVRVNAVSPGSVPTPGALGLNDPAEYERRARTIPLRRLGHEDDNANAVAFLLSPEASFITGEILNVDGGISAAG